MHLKCLRCFQCPHRLRLPFFPSSHLPKATNLHLLKPHQLSPRLLVELGLALPARHGGGHPGGEMLQRPPGRIPGEAEVLGLERAHRAATGDEAVPGGPDAAAERRYGAETRYDHAAAGGRARRR